MVSLTGSSSNFLFTRDFNFKHHLKLLSGLGAMIGTFLLFSKPQGAISFRAKPRAFQHAMYNLHNQHLSSLSANRFKRSRLASMNLKPMDASEEKSPFFITTPIYYVNGLPHLGHAYTSVATDVIARFHRKTGREVYFLTGTDEHGQKVQNSATEKGKTPLEFADETSSAFRSMVQDLQCSHDDFIRTTEKRHTDSVAKLWKQLEKNGHIYLGAYEGWYSIRDEAFYAEDELVDGKAPTGAEVEWVKEESYFFRLSSFTDKLLKFYEDFPDFIGPDGRRKEVISFVAQEGGLRDLSISRTTFSWGVPVPGHPEHVVYVWLDALTNYISALGYGEDENKGEGGGTAMFQKFWPASLHVVGKDILRFHCIYWPAFLMAAGIEPPKRIFAHGWWTIDGQKMSKSVGNVISPTDLLARYGVDFVRYFLIAEVTFGQDGDFSHEAFATRINSNLANDLGNLAQRVFTFTAKQCGGMVPEPGTPFTAKDEELLSAAENALYAAQAHLDKQALHRICEEVILVARMGNKYIDVEAPWTLKKTNVPRMQTVLYVLIETMRRLAIILEPVMPTSCSRLLDQAGADPSMRTFQSITKRIAPGTTMGPPSPVFPKIDVPK